MSWRGRRTDEALIISGFRAGEGQTFGASVGFRVVTGRGSLVAPGSIKVR
ncbi:hypothetical protein ACQP2U_26020 [Nocardia sp. CA-084685]